LSLFLKFSGGLIVESLLEEKLRRIRLLILDVDGVLTDGAIIYSDSGGEIKHFDVRDGHGIKLLMRAGIGVALVTARESRVVATRARDLGIDMLFQGRKDKLACFADILEQEGLGADETAFVGDDLVDLPVLRRVGFSASVPEGVKEVRERVDYITKAPGGRGAVREVCEMILRVQGLWDGLLQRYLE